MDKNKFAAALFVATIFGTLTVLGARATANSVGEALNEVIVALKK